MIIHSVIFTLKHDLNSEQAHTFLSDGKTLLSSIPSVKNFQVFKQTSVKNNYQYGFSMEFASQADYDAYNNHPTHEAFVNNRWNVEIEDFLEIDYEAYQKI